MFGSLIHVAHEGVSWALFVCLFFHKKNKYVGEHLFLPLLGLLYFYLSCQTIIYSKNSSSSISASSTSQSSSSSSSSSSSASNAALIRAFPFASPLGNKT